MKNTTKCLFAVAAVGGLVWAGSHLYKTQKKNGNLSSRAAISQSCGLLPDPDYTQEEVIASFCENVADPAHPADVCRKNVTKRLER